MGIQVFKQLSKQRAYALGEVRRLQRNKATQQEIAQAQRLLDSIDLVMAHQGVDVAYDRDHALERRPKRAYFPVGAYRGDLLCVLRREGRPMRIGEILNRLCEMHKVQLSPKEWAHAAIKLAQGNDVLIQRGFVERVDKEGPHRSAACRYRLRDRG